MEQVDQRDGPPGGPAGRLERAREVRAQADDAAVAEFDDRVEELLGLLGKSHAIAILRLFALEGGPWRFSELQERLDVSPNTLSDRLSELTDAGLLERHSYDEIPPRVEYTWTPRAEALTPAFDHLHQWAFEHGLAPRSADE